MNLTRRKFINFLGLGSLLSIRPLFLFSRNYKNPSELKAKEIFRLLKKKRESVKTVAYTVLQRIDYVNPNMSTDPEGENIMAENVVMELYWKANKIKTVVNLPTIYGVDAVCTSIYKAKMEYQEIKYLDGSRKNEYHSRRLSDSEIENLFYYLDDVLPMPKDNLITVIGEELINGESTCVLIQGNRKYWISPEKASVIRQAVYSSSDKLYNETKYENFKLFQPGILLPTLVIDKQFDKNGDLYKERNRQIMNIRINEVISDEFFKIQEEK